MNGFGAEADAQLSNSMLDDLNMCLLASSRAAKYFSLG